MIFNFQFIIYLHIDLKKKISSCDPSCVRYRINYDTVHIWYRKVLILGFQSVPTQQCGLVGGRGSVPAGKMAITISGGSD